MKVLIWIGCFIVVSVVMTLISEQGIVLGGVPTALLYMGGVTAARALSSRIDARRSDR